MIASIRLYSTVFYICKKDSSLHLNKNIMRFHPIFYKPYQIWWVVLAIICITKFYVFGFPSMYDNKNYGYLFWIIGTLFTGLVFGSIFYLIYRLLSRKWDNKIYMILVSILTVLVLFSL